jgi:DNA-binding winged helix-turn-helix (wHTH) protein/predicted ATPase
VKLNEEIVFPPFRLDPLNEQLWREDQLVPVRPKTFAVLLHLIEQAGQLVTKEELLKAVWPDTHVSDGILKGYIRDLRDILGDDAQQPRFIETVPRRGHKFIASVVSQQSVTSKDEESQKSKSKSQKSKIEDFSLAPSTQHPAPLLVGRDPELAHLHRLFVKAMRGERQIVFVTGEPGIGKTTLVENFLARAVSGSTFHVPSSPSTSATQSSSSSSPNPKSQILDPVFWLGRGQCVEQHGAGEAYLPVLEALGRIGRSTDGEPFVRILQQYAPTWLAQMPALVTAAEMTALQQRVVGATRERMLREMVEALEVLTTQRPLVLWFEDLHWADASTVDWLAAIAQQTAAARLLVVGTYRPSDLSLSGHPLKAVKQELVAKGQCEELLLSFLSADDVTQYLTRRYMEHQFPSELGAVIHRSTDGNPLFVVNTVEYLVAQGVIAEVDGQWRLHSRVEEVVRDVPDSLRQLIEKHVERLSEEQQRLLEAASVVGGIFSAVAVAAGIEAPVEQIEDWCEALVKRGQFIQAQEPSTFPDGTMCGRYQFLHALYHAVLYERIPTMRKVRLHRRVGDAGERVYGARAHEIAAELAVHFDRGGDFHRAVLYRQHAGNNALRQHGYREAITHFTRGLEIVLTLPDTPERRQQELALHVALGPPLQALHGYGAPEVETTYTRARELAQSLDEPSHQFPVLRGLYVFYVLRGKIRIAHEVGERLLSLAQSVQDPALLLEAHFALGQTFMFKGELLSAQEHLEQGITLYDPVQHRSHAFLYGQDPGVFCHILAGWNFSLQGYPDQALRMTQAGLAVAQEVAHPLSIGAAHFFFSLTHQLRREGRAAQEQAEAAIELCSQQGLPFFLALGTVVKGWALAEQGQPEEGIAQIRQGLTAFQATGAELPRTRIVALLAEALGKAGQPQEGVAVLDQMLTATERTEECDYEAELYRLRGELTLQQFHVSRFTFQVDQRPTSNVRSPKSSETKSQILTPNSHAEGEAEACFHKALTIAQKQHAKSLELRAVMSLVRLRQQQATQPAPRSTQHQARAKLNEAHSMLSEVYAWFTEGFDTKDLQEAKALIEQLSH